MRAWTIGSVGVEGIDGAVGGYVLTVDIECL